jgi:hypothetical protein
MKILAYLKEEDHRKAFVASLVFIMLMILFFLLVSLEEPDPPLKEQIVEIEMPDVEIEEGSSAAGGSPSKSEMEENPATEQVVQSAPDIVQQEESSVSIPKGTGNAKTDNTKAPEPKPDDGLTFSGSGSNQGTGSGNDFGSGTGVGGTGEGDKEGPGTYNPNRKVVQKANINSNAQEEGTIALDIWVDANGNVIQTRLKETESTSGSDYLISLAKKAAKTMKYEKKPGALKEHVGYQRFHFKKV